MKVRCMNPAIFRPDHDRIGTGAPCHDERLDPARRYGLVNVEGKFVVQDFARCTVEPWAFCGAIRRTTPSTLAC